jgi:site-specific recombinase XerD
MTSLRQRFIEDMQVRNFSPVTQASYAREVSGFARYFNKSPELLGPEQIRAYQVYLTNERKLGVVSISVATSALRFLYRVTLKKNWCMADMIPAPKVPKKLPIILSPEEVLRFLDCVAMRKHRAVLTTCYAAGLRISEAVALTLPAIDSQRMVLRVEQGKGLKDRYVMLSPKLLEILRAWWRIERPGHWLFPGGTPDQHITTTSVAAMCRKARRISEIPKPITPHSMRHAFACHLLEWGTDIRQIQLLLGHRSLETTAKYLHIATSKVCSTSSPLDLLPRPVSMEVQPTPSQHL